MDDAISRSAVLDRLEMLRWNYGLKAGYRDAMTDAIGEVRNALTIDAVPVVHARWVAERERTGHYSHCSKCECRCQGYVPNYKYCPNCGARMDGEANG